MAIKTRSKTTSSGAKKKANLKNQERLSSRDVNLETGVNPVTKKQFFVIEGKTILASFQTRRGANRFKLYTHQEGRESTKLAVVEANNLVKFFTNRFFAGTKVTEFEWNTRFEKTKVFVNNLIK